jgi:hypothetical protein
MGDDLLTPCGYPRYGNLDGVFAHSYVKLAQCLISVSLLPFAD